MEPDQPEVEPTSAPDELAEPIREPIKAQVARASPPPEAPANGREVLELREQLAQRRTQLQDVVEQFEPANEEFCVANDEIQSSNEGLQSTNKELETSKEVLQATNEELTTLNEELQNRNLELTSANTELKSQAIEARTYAETIVETVRECILVLDAKLRVTRANSTFYETFSESPKGTEGRLLQDLGEGQWNVPHLLELLTGVLTGDAELRNFEVEREFPALGPRTMVLNARRIRREGQADGKILLAIEDITEWRSMETVRNQARLIDLAHDAIIVRDPESVISSWNQGAESLYGFSRREAIGKVSHILLNTVFPQPLEELHRRLLAQGEWEGEMTQTARSGDRIVVASRQAVQRDDQGRPVATLEINRDITERRQAEEWLRASEARLRALVNSMDDAVFEIDAHGTCLNVWTANERLLIRPRSELIGHSIEAFLPAESARAIMQACKRVCRTRRPESIEYAVEVAGGQRWFVARISPLASSQGKPATLSLLVRDITPGKKAEILVRESEERFRLLMEGVRDYAIVMLEAEGHIASWNSGAERINGYRADEIMGKHFSIFYPPEAARSGEPQRALQTAAAKDRVETEGWRVRKDGSRFRANVVLTAVRDHGGDLPRSRATSRS